MVLSYLDVVCINRLATVSRFYASLLNDQSIWKTLCDRYHISAASATLPHSLSNSPSTTASHKNDFDSSTRLNNDHLQPPSLRSSTASTLSPPPSDPRPSALINYKRHFSHAYVIRRNWHSGTCKHFSIDGPQAAIVTSLQFNQEILAIATDNASYGLIELFDGATGARFRKLIGHEGEVAAAVRLNHENGMPFIFNSNTIVSKMIQPSIQ